MFDGDLRKGLKRLLKPIPMLIFICKTLDSHLNENGYIVPGLGDAGDHMLAQNIIS